MTNGPPPAFPALSRLTGAPWFRHSILAAIVLAGIVVGLETSKPLMAEWGGLLRGLDWFIMGVFTVELVLRLAAHLPAPGRFSGIHGMCLISSSWSCACCRWAGTLPQCSVSRGSCVF